MNVPLQITFRDMGPSEAVESHVRRRVEKLSHGNDRLVSCHVVLEAPHRSHRHGGHYRVRVQVTVPGREIVVDRAPAEDPVDEDLHTAIDHAFDHAVRQIHDEADRRRAR